MWWGAEIQWAHTSWGQAGNPVEQRSGRPTWSRGLAGRGLKGQWSGAVSPWAYGKGFYELAVLLVNCGMEKPSMN
jgi:hypothetical protein